MIKIGSQGKKKGPKLQNSVIKAVPQQYTTSAQTEDSKPDGFIFAAHVMLAFDP